MASELIANADFPCGFCCRHCARFDGRKYCQIALWTRLLARGYKQQLANIPFKNGGLNRLSANLSRHALAKSPYAALRRPAQHSAISCLAASPTPVVVRVEGSITQASEKPAHELTSHKLQV